MSLSYSLFVLSCLIIVASIFRTSPASSSLVSFQRLCTNMSESQIPSIPCSTCGRQVNYVAVRSTANGNQGRWLAQCHQRNPETSETCNFFRWLHGSRTPSLSPRRVSTNAAPQPGGSAPGQFFPIPGAGGVHANLSSIPPKKTCRTMGCNSTRIRKACTTRRCKAHCQEIGDCADPAHKGSKPSSVSFMMAAPPTTIPTPLFPETTYSTAVPLDTRPSSSLDPRLCEIQAPSALIAPLSEAPMNTRTGPAFSSHMVDIYTTQIALEEKMRETGRQMEATRLESKRKVQQTVFVYAWMEDGDAPALFEVQEGFVWPNFILNEAVLTSAGFTIISANTRFNIFRFNLGHWTTVKLNHVVDIKDTARVFIKATHVQRCKDFENFLTSTSSSATAPNIRTNLAGERAYVKKKMVEHEISQALTALAVRNKHRISPENLSSTPKRHRFLSDEAPTPTITRYRAPIPPPKFTGKRQAGATQVVKRKVSVAARELEMMDCYDSDSGLEFTDPFPFSNASPALRASPPASRAHTTTFASTSALPFAFSNPSPLPSTSQSVFATPTFTPPSSSSYARPTIKQEAQESIEELHPFSVPKPYDSASKKPRWPGDFFAIDIANCFNEIEDNAGDAWVRSVFDQYFGRWVPYKNSTFYEHRGRWQGVSLEAKQAALSAGRTTAGRWTNFMSTTPAPRALLKAARKRNSKRVNHIVGPDVIEISSDEEGEA